jgi:hypothetical protein
MPIFMNSSAVGCSDQEACGGCSGGWNCLSNVSKILQGNKLHGSLMNMNCFLWTTRVYVSGWCVGFASVVN